MSFASKNRIDRKSSGKNRWAVFAISFAVLASAEHLAAQELGSTFGGFAASPDEPIDIQANRLDVDDKAKRAIFTGSVKAAQDTFTMNSNSLEVLYASRTGAKKSSAGSGLGGGSTEITRLIARGKVFIQSAKQQPQTASGDWAEFDVKKRIITMGDLVTLKQGRNIIRGTRLVINLNTGKSSVLSSNPAAGKKSGQIRMVITPDKSLRNRTRSSSPRGQTQKTPTSASQPVRATRGNQ